MPGPRRLICTLGESPGVVTEALDKFFFDPKERRDVEECLIVHTNAPKVLESVKKVLSAFEGGTHDGGRVRGATYPCRVPGVEGRAIGPLDLEIFDLEFPDLVTEEQHVALMGRLAFWIAQARQAGQPVEVCLAGGRKTESACAAIAAQFFGADRVVHVLPTRLTQEDLRSGGLHFELQKYDLTRMPLLDLSPITYKILDARGEKVRSAEDALRVLAEFTNHIPALAAREVERVYTPPRPGRTAVFGSIETQDTDYAEALERAQAAATSDSHVLLTGETGVGKEVLARAIHAMSPRRNAPFKHFQCGQYTSNLFEGELFGVERGAHSEAKTTRPGPLEDAGTGTIFIDEIDSLTLPQQARLLRLVQSREFERVGGRDTIRVKARFIFATNRDLDALIREGAFRDDLRNRIHTIEIAIPPLRTRRRDIPALARTLLRNYCDQRRLDPPELGDEALEILTKPDWMGNVRDLEQALREWIDVGVAKGFPIAELRKCVNRKNRASALVTDEAGRQLERVLAGDLEYAEFKTAATPQEICRLVLRARAHYQEHVKGTMPLEKWTRKHFDLKSLDPDKTRYCPKKKIT